MKIQRLNPLKQNYWKMSRLKWLDKLLKGFTSKIKKKRWGSCSVQMKRFSIMQRLS